MTCGACHYFEGCAGERDAGCGHPAIPRISTDFDEEACDRWAEVGSVHAQRGTIQQPRPMSKQSAQVEDRARANRIKQEAASRNKDLCALESLIRPIANREAARSWNYRDRTGERHD